MSTAVTDKPARRGRPRGAPKEPKVSTGIKKIRRGVVQVIADLEAKKDTLLEKTSQRVAAIDAKLEALRERNVDRLRANEVLAELGGDQAAAQADLDAKIAELRKTRRMLKKL